MAIDISRASGFDLPTAVSNEIMQKATNESAIMSLARNVSLPGAGVSIPVILSDSTAQWVGETSAKPVSNAEIDTKILRPYKIAVIEAFSDEFVRDASALYNALIDRMPYSLAKVFDNTVIGGTTAPGSDFDQFDASTAVTLTASTAYDQLVAADGVISASGRTVNGYALAPQARTVLLTAKDGNDRPLFINSAADGAIPMILGSRTEVNAGVYDSTKKIIGVAGDWTQAMYGTVEGLKVTVSDQTTLPIGDSGAMVSLFQNNMIAVRMEMEVGFVCDTSAFVVLKSE